MPCHGTIPRVSARELSEERQLDSGSRNGKDWDQSGNKSSLRQDPKETTGCRKGRSASSVLRGILGIRKYVTTNFDISPESNNELRIMANNPETKNKCIAWARVRDKELKELKKELRRTQKNRK